MFHLKAIEALEDVEVTAVADRNNARAVEVKERCGARKACLDYRALLADPGVDAVAINTPPRFHEQMVVESLESGKHVLCEKPLAETVEGCLRIRKLQGETGLVVLPGHNYAFTPSLGKMAGLIEEGAIGDLRGASISFENNLRLYNPRTDFRFKEDHGIVEDIMPHILSVSSPIAGAAKTVERVEAWRKRYEVYDNVEVSVMTGGGVGIDCSLSWTSLVPRFRVEALGSRGRIRTDLMLSPYTVTIEAGGENRKVKGRGLGWYLDLVRFRHPSFKNQYRHLVGLVEGSEEPMLGIEEEIGMLRVMEEVVRRLKEEEGTDGSGKR